MKYGLYKEVVVEELEFDDVKRYYETIYHVWETESDGLRVTYFTPKIERIWKNDGEPTIIERTIVNCSVLAAREFETWRLEEQALNPSIITSCWEQPLAVQ